MITQTEFDTILSDSAKRIEGDISWSEDEDHSPSWEFRVEVESSAGYPLFVRGSYNPLIPALTYAMIHRGAGRIYGLDLGKDHHNPDCCNVGEKHKHSWTEQHADKRAYVPAEVTALADDPVSAWEQFCCEASIIHNGELHRPPWRQMEFF